MTDVMLGAKHCVPGYRQHQHHSRVLCVFVEMKIKHENPIKSLTSATTSAVINRFNQCFLVLEIGSNNLCSPGLNPEKLAVYGRIPGTVPLVIWFNKVKVIPYIPYNMFDNLVCNIFILFENWVIPCQITQNQKNFPGDHLRF